MKVIFGILGAVAAALYWKWAVHAHPEMTQADWITVSGYAAIGVVIALVIGLALWNMFFSDK